MLHKIVFVGLLCHLMAIITNAFEENDKFCISTEPMLLTDLEKHINPKVGDPHCDITAATLTLKEKESFLNTMCKDHGSSHKDDYYFLKLRNGDLTGRGKHSEICAGKTNPLLAWIPYDMILRNYAQELDPKERLDYVGKATDVEREKTELCHFRHTDLVTNITSNLFTCIVMIFEDNFYGLDSNINVLVEIQPLMYEIRNITYLPWMNVTSSYKTMLGRTSLKNPSREQKQIYGSVNYAYVEKVKLNMTSVYSENMEQLPLLLEHMGSVLELDENGIGGVDVKTKAYFGRIMDPKSMVKVEVIGQWAEHRQQFNGDIYEYFGYGIKRFRIEQHQGDISFVRIESTEPVYEMPESNNLASVTLHKTHVPGNGNQKFERLTEESVNNSKHVTDDAFEGEHLEDFTSGESPYPGLYPWFVLSTIVLAIVLLAAIYGIVRHYSKNEDKHKYKVAGAGAGA